MMEFPSSVDEFDIFSHFNAHSDSDFEKGQLIRWRTRFYWFRMYSPFITWIIYENNLIKTSVLQRTYKSDELFCSLIIPPTLSHTNISTYAEARTMTLFGH